MKPKAFDARWRALVAGRGLDPRRHYWRREGSLLLLRPGAALTAARELAAEDLAGTPELRVLGMEQAWRVKVSQSSLRREPGHEAEQISQLRLGQAFNSWWEDSDGAWLLGAGADGYPGWLRAWHLVPGAAAQGALRVTARRGTALAAPETGAETILDLSFGTLVPDAGERREEHLAWTLPDGRLAWTPLADLELAPAPKLARSWVLLRARRLLGIPYLWGGNASEGFDCSGLVQTLLGAAGIALPRDADLQIRIGSPRNPGLPESWRPGDLLFYGEAHVDHVGMLLGQSPLRLFHASSEVKVEDLGPGGELLGKKPLHVQSPFQGVEDA